MKKYFNKYTVAAFIIGAVLFSSIGVFADTMNVSKNPFPVFIDGIEAKVEAYNIGGYTYLKLGDLKQAGLKVVFNETDKKIEITTATAEAPKPVETNQPATPTQPTPTTPVEPSNTAPVQITTPEPEPEPEEPDLAAYNAKLDLLTATYNQDVDKIKSDAREKANQVSSEFNKKYSKYKQLDPISYEMAFNAMRANINAIEKEADKQITLRTDIYNAEVEVLKQEYGVK